MCLYNVYLLKLTFDCHFSISDRYKILHAKFIIATSNINLFAVFQFYFELQGLIITFTQYCTRYYYHSENINTIWRNQYNCLFLLFVHLSPCIVGNHSHVKIWKSKKGLAQTILQRGRWSIEQNRSPIGSIETTWWHRGGARLFLDDIFDISQITINW